MTSWFRRAVVACLFLLLFFGLAAVLANRDVAFASNSEARDRGATAFQTRGCERCHSILGIGGDRAPDLAMVGTRKSASQIKTQIIKGGRSMPPFEDVLSKDEVKDLVVFLTSCRTDIAPGCRQWMRPEAAQ